MLSAHIDDMTGEGFGCLLETLLEAGALDVGLIPMTMKKTRPAVMVQVVARPKDEEKLVQMLLAESTTLGVRAQQMRRYAAGRHMVSVHTEYGEIACKVAEATLRAMPEYDAVRQAARAHQVPFLTVYQAAQCAAMAMEQTREQ